MGKHLNLLLISILILGIHINTFALNQTVNSDSIPAAANENAPCPKDSLPFISTLKLEVRADFTYQHTMLMGSGEETQHLSDDFGFKGRYFNFIMSGNLNGKFSYHIGQRIIANPGSVSLFDNTDFLWINFKLNKHWSFRIGKDALAVGSFEYDATPIDVFISTYYWDAFYCFRLGGSVTYTTKDEKSNLTFQVTSSPYIHYGTALQKSLLSYNLMWKGQYGPFIGLYSVNMFQRDPTHYMFVLSLGNKVKFNTWDLYLDFMHRATNTSSIMKDFSVVLCGNYYFSKYLNLYAKISFEQNSDPNEFAYYRETGEIWDELMIPGMRYMVGGLGIEYRPKSCPDFRIHGVFFCNAVQNVFENNSLDLAPGRTLFKPSVHAGVTWTIDVKKYINKKVK